MQLLAKSENNLGALKGDVYRYFDIPFSFDI